MKKLARFGLGLAAIATTTSLTLVLSSCSSSYSEYQKAKIINMPLFNGFEKDHNISINDVTEEVNVNVKDLVRGTNSFNGGKYVFIYGSIGYTDVTTNYSENDNSYGITTNGTISSFYKWLTRQETKDKVDEVNHFKDLKIGNTFFDAWFNDTKDGRSPYKDVKIVSYIDIPPLSEDADSKNDIEKFIRANPFETWDEQDVFNIYKYYCRKNNTPTSFNDFSELPINWKLLSGAYIRQDDSAKAYREFVNYVKDIRPNMSPVTDNADLNTSGMIAFNTTSKNPLSYKLSRNDIVSSIGDATFDSITDYNAGSTWKAFYALYNGETWDDAIGETNKNPEGGGESNTKKAQRSTSK